MADVYLTPIRKGDPRTITVTVVDPDGNPVDLSASTWHSTARPMANSSIGTAVAIDTSQASAGVLSLSLTGEQTRIFNQTMVADLQGSAFGTLLTLDAIILPDVTREPGEPGGGFADNVTVTLGDEGASLSASVLAVLIPRSQLVGFVYHGADPTVARPSGYAKIEWQGSVHPINAISPDTVIREDLQE